MTPVIPSLVALIVNAGARVLRGLSFQSLRLILPLARNLCIYDLDGYETAPHLTADFVYLRLHGPNGPYRGRYSDQALERWAETLQGWADRGLDTYCWFDNDEAGHAPRNRADERNSGAGPRPGCRL
ncbi:hypothetical protein CKO42_12775 [Lamprobacter modestohalophilus]|uniref:DUF72 domain-containing protein n=1 Tax=Lamprobacter modestohalophilus TaxID=1064514 RepID=A0A9X0W9H5_9GAMM|nr:DUF72 domain-containing protein [Lamprobacter modestohalophilus]MBK1619294.1 hypothetical protein [Lamprobacter modestohalophilus]